MNANTPNTGKRPIRSRIDQPPGNGAGEVEALPQALVDATAEHLKPFLREEGQAPIVAQATLLLARENFSGPLPHPKHFERYECILAGSADRILSMAEREQKHRHFQANLANAYPYIGMIAGLLLASACIAAGFALALQGQLGGAALVLGVPVLGMVGWFVKARIGTAEQKMPATQAGKSSVAAGKRPRR